MLKFRCQCNNLADHVEVGTTSDGCLLNKWKCAGCESHIIVKTPLEELIANLPPQPETGELSKSDEEFLKGFNISGGLQ